MSFGVITHKQSGILSPTIVDYCPRFPSDRNPRLYRDLDPEENPRLRINWARHTMSEYPVSQTIPNRLTLNPLLVASKPNHTVPIPTEAWNQGTAPCDLSHINPAHRLVLNQRYNAGLSSRVSIRGLWSVKWHTSQDLSNIWFKLDIIRGIDVSCSDAEFAASV